jgi:hypothetical protein
MTLPEAAMFPETREAVQRLGGCKLYSGGKLWGSWWPPFLIIWCVVVGLGALGFGIMMPNIRGYYQGKWSSIVGGPLLLILAYYIYSRVKTAAKARHVFLCVQGVVTQYGKQTESMNWKEMEGVEYFLSNEGGIVGRLRRLQGNYLEWLDVVAAEDRRVRMMSNDLVSGKQVLDAVRQFAASRKVPETFHDLRRG